MDLSDLIKAISERKEKTRSYDTTAVVRRIEGRTAWVHIPGGVEETPVKMTIKASPGDTVQIRIGGGKAWITGNATAPPTDDTLAIHATRAVQLVEKVVSKVKEVAESAQKIAGNTNQYFWHTKEGSDTGAHITELPQEEFLEDPENGGANLLARSNGIAIREGTTELAAFAADFLRIGQEDEANIQLSTDSENGSMLIFNDGTTYVPVKIVGKNYVGYIKIDNDQIIITGSHQSSQQGVNIDRVAVNAYGVNNQRHAVVFLDAYGISGRSYIEISDFSGIKLESDNILVNGDLKVNGGQFYPQKDGTTWTAPTVSGSAATISSGGYYMEGKRVYVQMRCVLAAALNANTARTLFTGMPVPSSVDEVALSVLVRSRAGHACRITDTGDLQIVSDPDHSISANQNITITGVYTTTI